MGLLHIAIFSLFQFSFFLRRHSLTRMLVSLYKKYLFKLIQRYSFESEKLSVILLFSCFVCKNIQWLFLNICIWMSLLFTNEQKTKRQLLMALRNRVISIGHSIRSPQVPSPARAEAKTSYYRIANVFPICNLMVSSTLISLTEQNLQLPLQRFPSESFLTS